MYVQEQSWYFHGRKIYRGLINLEKVYLVQKDLSCTEYQQEVPLSVPLQPKKVPLGCIIFFVCFWSSKRVHLVFSSDLLQPFVVFLWVSLSLSVFFLKKIYIYCYRILLRAKASCKTLQLCLCLRGQTDYVQINWDKACICNN